jgi:hypothetical protein
MKPIETAAPADRLEQWAGLLKRVDRRFRHSAEAEGNMAIDPARLRRTILRSLRNQGYEVRNGIIRMSGDPEKDFLRGLNQQAVSKKLAEAKPHLQRHETRLIEHIANGTEVDVHRLRPRVVAVRRDSDDELLFRYAALHWSIPVSSGYGRRLRFLVRDEYNGKLIGLFGLSDPVFSMHDRDRWIGWDSAGKASRLYHVMDAHILGAVPPYSMLLGGKLVAMLVFSNEVRKAFRKRYAGHKSLISQKERPPHLVLITTTSAFGRSSLYNRIRIGEHTYWHRIGCTQGSGEFHFSNGVYEDIRAFVELNCQPTAKHLAWGHGFRNKREVVRKCLVKLGLSDRLLYHGIQRDIFAAPLGRNALSFLQGRVQRPALFNHSTEELFERFAERWLYSRVARRPEYRQFERSAYLLWRDCAM